MVTTQPKINKANLIEQLLKIDNKQGMVVPYCFNKAQRYFHENKSNRNIILKARQLGISSSILADMFTDCILIPHTPCAVVSHETRATQRLLDRVHFYYQTMEDPKPVAGAESRTEISFPDLHSSIYIGTAGSRAFGRGDTIRKALLSELAFYEDGEKILTGVEDAVPITGELTIECSPNGEDNAFYEKWVKAREGKSPYKPFFFPWWWASDYQIPRFSPLALPEDMGELSLASDEVELIERYHLTEDQIRWRRWKIAEKGGLFWQEFPEDEVSCFITIGDPVFDTLILNQMAHDCTEGQHYLTNVNNLVTGWQFWIPPEPKMQYVIGADTSSGAPTGSYSAAVVLDNLWRVCATYQARLEPHLFALLLKQMGMWYNNAVIAVERNFTGYAVLGHMLDYNNVYHQRDFTTNKVTAQRGWWTNEQTKGLMQTVLKDKLVQLRIWNINLVRQLRAFRFIKVSGRMKAEAQTFVDLAMALMIACAVRKVEGASRGYQGAVKGWSW